MSWLDVRDYYEDYEESDDTLPNRCKGCGAFIPARPTSIEIVQGPDIVRWTGVDCKRCRREAWGFEEVIASVYPPFDWTGGIEPMEQLDYPSEHEYQAAILKRVEESPVVATCECGNEIRQGEIDLRMADGDSCSSCVLAYVANLY